MALFKSSSFGADAASEMKRALYHRDGPKAIARASGRSDKAPIKPV